MYVPSSFAVDEPERLFQFIEQYPFATFITAAGGELFASHLPLLVDRTAGERGTLRGHVAKANPHWQVFDGQIEALAIFHGPHAYVSPSWYLKQPAVPTWNYAAVHVYGRPRVIEGAAETSQVLDDLLARFETADAPEQPEDFRRSLEAGIVAFAMPIDRWQGKFKLNQNRSVEDREQVVKTLTASDRAEDRQLGEFMRQMRKPG